MLLERIREKLASRIKSNRIAKGLTQAELAEELNFSDSFIGQLERGETMPSVEALQQIINALAIDPRELFLDIPQGDTNYTELGILMLRMNPRQQAFLIEFAKILLKY